MPEGNPRYIDLPRPESITFFERSTQTHKEVSSLNKIEEQKYNVSRFAKSELNLYLTNLYIVGVADVHRIIQEFPDVNCIVTISCWNSYSSEARAFCETNGIGLFKYNEYYGALYYDNSKFYCYEPPEKE